MKSNPTRRLWSKRLLKYAAVPVAALLILLVGWTALNGPRGADICAGIALLLFILYMVNLKRSDARADQNIAQRIRAEYSGGDQSQMFELYDRLKAKELEYLFLKVLDDARGNLAEAKKLTGLAETIGWQAFLENRW